MSSPPSTIIFTDPRYRNGVLVNESALLDEWLSVRYPGVKSMGRLRLGPTSASVQGVTLTAEQSAMLSVLNWYADGIVLAPAEQLIIEAKVVAKPSAIGEVLFYRRLLAQTPELKQVAHLTFQPVVLFAEDDESVSDFARSFGVRVEIYTPPWIADYLSRVQFRGRQSRQG
jgi:hypothetical protein